MRDGRRCGGMACWALWGLALVLGLSGCESLQRKFTRRSKQQKPPPTPIINFQDYSKAMTPLDRYRKHCLIFDYWNDDLLQALQGRPLNPKRVHRASTESLAELEVMQQLVADDVAQRMAPLFEERAALNRQLQGGPLNDTQASTLQRSIERQARHIDREFFWRDVQDQLKP